MKDYYCYVEWNYRIDPPIDRCVIGKIAEENRAACEEQDGANFVGGSGLDGMNFDLCDSLEDAILKSNYKLEYIDQVEFDHISAEEINKAMSNINKRRVD